MKNVAFYTLGCKVNQYETEAISELFEDDGCNIVPYSDKADIYVINTCSVTAMSDRKSRQMIRRAKKANPDAVIAVMGCYSQTAPDEVLDIDGVNLVLGTKDRASVVRLTKELTASDKVNAITSVKDNHTFEELNVRRCLDHTRAYIKIQDGCSQFCSYCIIPYARGPIRSRREEDILSEAKKLAAAGFKEIILTGIHAASYGKDLGCTSLGQLINKIDKCDGIRRIRLSSIEPMTLDSEFIESIRGAKKLCPHFHISLQSGCDATLKRMNRKYTAGEFAAIADGLRKAFTDCAITTDIMVGFAGETDAEFAETLSFTEALGFAEAHVFQYSPRRGTPAARFKDQVPPEVKEARSKAIIELTNRTRDEFLSRHTGKTMEILFETRASDGFFEGKTANYINIHAPSDADISGQFLQVKLTRHENGIMYGEIIPTK